jgi:ACT domain-containing protein
MQYKENNLNLTVVPSDFLKKVEQDLTEMKDLLRTKSDDEINSQWIESVKVPDILGISRKTWQTYRDKRLIPFSQIGSKIYVKRADIEEFMQSHYISSNTDLNYINKKRLSYEK